MFSPTEKRGIRLRSWCTALMPAAIASRGDAKRDLAAVEEHPARVGPVDAGDDLDQRRLAGAVLAHQRVDLAGPEVERDVVERLDAGEGLARVLDR